MKHKIYSLFAFLIFSFAVKSQKSEEIPLPYSTSGYSENQPNRGSVKKTTSNALISSVNAEMNVSESGALIYSLPIEILQGLNKFQPNITLGYNSQSGNGQAGWGWNIIGLSNISRGGKSKEIDGITIGPQFNNDDPFYLDGQRLIKVNETTFVTEKFSKIKITKPVTGEYQFIIQYTDGRVAKYKELVTGQYYISTLINALNNEIHYTYQVDNRVPLITRISYGGTGVSNDPFYVNFVYKQRQKNIQIFRKGESFTTTKVLDEINTGSTYTPLYRKYKLSYDLIEDNAVERLKTVMVSNESGETLKPLNFNYNTTGQGVVKVMGRLRSGLTPGTTGLGSVTMGDFVKGEGEKLQAVYQKRTTNGYTLSIGTAYKSQNLNADITNNSATLLFSGKVLDLGDKLTEKDQLIVVNEKTIGTGDIYNPNSAANQQLRDEVVFAIKNLVTGEQRVTTVPVKGGLAEVQTYIPPDPYDNYRDGTYETSYTRDETRREYIQGDFNNDGLVDFLILEPSNVNRTARIYFVELGKKNSGTAIELNPTILSQTLNLYGKDIYPIEFDGDGLPELMAVDKYNARYSVYKINFSDNTINAVLTNQVLTNFGSDTPLFFGDFNGDGLTDFLTPQKVYDIPTDDSGGLKMGNTYYKMQTEQLLWSKYIGNGAGFVKNDENYTDQKIAYVKPSQSNYIKRSTFWQKFWNGKPDEYAYTRYSTHNIIVTDFNNDGRSDIVVLNKIGAAKYNTDGSLAGVPINNLSNGLVTTNAGGIFPVPYFSSITNRVTFYENKNLQGGTFKQLITYPIDNVAISPLSLITSTTNFDYLNVSKSGVHIYDPILAQSLDITVDNSNFLEKQIQEVDNGSGVLQRIEYRNIIPSKTQDEATYLYRPQETLKYPYFVHETNPTFYFTHKIHTVFDNKILSKEYRYENGIQNLEGKGFLGFQKTYTSDPFESEIKNGKYSNKNPVKAVFWNIEAKDPLMDNAVISSTYGGLNKYFTITSVINKKYDKGNHQYLILSTDENTKDNLKKIEIKKKYEYDISDDLKLKTASTDYNGIGSTVSKYTYKPEFSDGEHYFYGKNSTSETIIYKDGLSFLSKEETDYYPNGNTKEIRKYGNQPNSQPVITSYTYDNIGNIKTETLATSGIASRTTTFDYDATNRFVSKITTPDGLVSTLNVSPLGRTNSSVSSLGLATSYIYDGWGNITEVTDFLGKKTTTSKSIADPSTGGVYNVHTKREGGTELIVTLDKFDREILSKKQSINNKWVATKTEYDIFGLNVRTSEPFFDGEPVKWNTIEYDELNRPVKNTTFTGKVITTCYEGMKVTVDDGYKKAAKTLDAMGHVIKQEDHGGVLLFSYYPNGAPKETNYEGIKTSFEIDGWGNKTKMKDPSAGTFTYEYDNLSRVTKEITPKGYTLYTYDDLGRMQTEKTYGNTTAENTNIEKTFTYNGQTPLPQTVTGTSNGKQFTYTTYYDQYYRVNGKKEETPDFTYTSNTSYDAFGRSEGVDISTKVTGYTSTSSIKNIYDANGILIQQNDNKTGVAVWHLTSVNAKGQTTQLEYGNGYTMVNQYNPTDLSLSNMKQQNTNNGLVALDIDYNYDVNKGVLNWRRNNSFNKKEDFTYDKLNRLLTEAVNGVVTNEYTYDKRGRITSNTELGKYNYNETDYKLRGIDFNTNGQNVNATRGFANIAYNAFKSPLTINMPGKDYLHFSYNILKTRYSMGSLSNNATKFYSSDFAVEIKSSIGNVGGNLGRIVEIITYLTGDPYSANYIQKEVIKEGVLSERGNYYLHRDNLGSIVAISKNDGSIVEKRFFDAWGNLKGLVNESGQTITDAAQLRFTPLFIDRGYTGHEHLQTVGLINMNARIYDPVVRKFLSPDLLVSDPYNTQSYDRFGYVYNNPLLYVDIDGNEAALGVAVLIGVAIALVSKAILNMINGIPFWYGLGKAAVIGGVSAVVSFGIGSVATSTFGTGLSVGKALFEAGMHAVSGGLMSVLDGAKFGAGALSGAISSLIASGVQKLGDLGEQFSLLPGAEEGVGIVTTFGDRNAGLLKALMVTSGGLSGGVSSSIAGGNFWQGFRQGLISSGLNHVAHMVSSFLKFKSLRQEIEDAKLNPDDTNVAGRWGELIEKVPSLTNMAKAITSRHGVLNIEDVTEGGGAFSGETNKVTFHIKLNIASIMNKTLLGYAHTLGHELIHSFDWQFNMPDWVSKYGSGGDRSFDLHDLREVRAWRWNVRMGYVLEGDQIMEVSRHNNNVDNSAVLQRRYNTFTVLNPWQ